MFREITWLDRENLIQAGSFDIIDNLPHFLLVLLILQGFDLARWGFFTEFDGSPIHPKRDFHSRQILEAAFEGGTTLYIFPGHDSFTTGPTLPAARRGWSQEEDQRGHKREGLRIDQKR